MTSQNLTPFQIKYHESLTEKLGFIQKYLDNPSLLLVEKEDLRQILHKIVGSGGMYGYDDLSEKARHLHGKLHGIDEGSSKEVTDVTKQIAEFIAFVNNIIHAE